MAILLANNGTILDHSVVTPAHENNVCYGMNDR